MWLQSWLKNPFTFNTYVSHNFQLRNENSEAKFLQGNYVFRWIALSAIFLYFLKFICIRNNVNYGPQSFTTRYSYHILIIKQNRKMCNLFLKDKGKSFVLEKKLFAKVQWIKLIQSIWTRNRKKKYSIGDHIYWLKHRNTHLISIIQNHIQEAFLICHRQKCALHIKFCINKMQIVIWQL